MMRVVIAGLMIAAALPCSAQPVTDPKTSLYWTALQRNNVLDGLAQCNGEVMTAKAMIDGLEKKIAELEAKLKPPAGGE